MVGGGGGMVGWRENGSFKRGDGRGGGVMGAGGGGMVGGGGRMGA